jgi:hypothetical protein
VPQRSEPSPSPAQLSISLSQAPHHVQPFEKAVPPLAVFESKILLVTKLSTLMSSRRNFFFWFSILETPVNIVKKKGFDTVSR